MTARNSQKRRWGIPGLDLSSGLRWAFRREVRCSVGPRLRVAETARAVLNEAGFELVRSPARGGRLSGAPSTKVAVWVGERGVRRRGGTTSTAVVPIITVLVAGGILGGFDAFLVGSLLVIGYWMLGAVAVAAAFWLRYGRAYDSDLAMVTLSDPAPSPGTVSVVFWAARVRSQVHSGVRIPTNAGGPVWLAAELGAVAREFERRISEPVGREGSASASP